MIELFVAHGSFFDMPMFLWHSHKLQSHYETQVVSWGEEEKKNDFLLWLFIIIKFFASQLRL